MRKSSIILVALSLAGVIAAGAWWIADQRSVMQVMVTQVQREPIIQELRVIGKVTTKRQVVLNPLIDGQIISVDVKVDQYVKKGDAIVHLDPSDAYADMQRKEATLARTSEDLAQSKRNWDYLVRLYEIGGEAKHTVDDAESRVIVAQAMVEEAKKDLELSKFKVMRMIARAPFDGLITSCDLYIGQRVSTSTPLITLANIGELEVEAQVNVSDVAAVAVGQKVKITSDGYPKEMWVGKVKQLGTSVVREDKDKTSNVIARISFDGDYRPLRFGEQVDVKITTKEVDSTLVLPFSAITSNKEQSWVATVENGRLRHNKVRTGIENLTHTEITEGVKEGQEVVLLMGRKMRDGSKVRAINRRNK